MTAEASGGIGAAKLTDLIPRSTPAGARVSKDGHTRKIFNARECADV
jgi:hypothetical protein